MMGRKAARYLAGATALVGSIALTAPAAFAQSPPEAAAERSGGVGELIVTARKREESLQDVPMAVSAISGDTLEQSGQSNLADLGHLAPNVFFEAADRSRPYIYIRGIGTRTYDPGTDSSVGVFIDGVYQARLATLDMDLLDVERVEVLRGPQGTLYGKNTIGGAISVVTRDPSETFTARANAEYGQGAVDGDSLYGVWGAIAGPLAENVTASLALSRRYRDGYQPINNQDVAGGSENSWSLRGKVRIALSDAVSLRLNGWYSDASGPPIIFVLNTLNGTRPNAAALSPLVTTPPPQSDPYHPNSDRGDIHLDKQVYGGAATLAWSMGEIDLTSITAYQQLEIDELWDGDASIRDSSWATNPEVSDQFSEEFRISRTGDRLNWMLGVFYAHETADRSDNLVFGRDSLLGFLNGGTMLVDLGFDLDTTSYAAFGQASYDFTDRVSATIGARYSVDKKDVVYNTVSTGPAFIPSYRLDLPEQEWESFDPSASLTYRITDDVSVYGSVATGYKSGAFQFAAVTAIDAALIVNPEEVTSYELGLKSMLFDQRLRFNVAAFHMDYKDLQTARVVPTPIGGRVRIANAAAATIDGVEIETLTALTDEWSLLLNYSFLDATYDEYIFGPGLDFSGNRLQRAPENTVNAALLFAHDFEAGRFDARLGYYWRDSIFFEADNNAVDFQSSEDPLGLWDASASFTHEEWTFTLWGTNLSDERYRRSVLNSTGNAQRELWAEPRTVGVRLTLAYE